MLLRYVAPIVTGLFISMSAVETIKAVGDLPIIRVEQSQLINSPMSNTSSCLIAYTSDKVHVESRSQNYEQSKADVKVYDGILNEEQRQELEKLINSVAVASLPPFEWPLMHGGTILLRRGTTVQIYGGDRVRTVGYAAWRGASSSDSLEGAPPEIKDAQKHAEIALQPLLRWVDQVKGSSLKPSTAEPSLCEVH